ACNHKSLIDTLLDNPSATARPGPAPWDAGPALRRGSNTRAGCEAGQYNLGAAPRRRRAGAGGNPGGVGAIGPGRAPRRRRDGPRDRDLDRRLEAGRDRALRRGAVAAADA